LFNGIIEISSSANKGLAAPAFADGFHTPLSSLPDCKLTRLGKAVQRKKGGVQWQAAWHPPGAEGSPVGCAMHNRRTGIS